MLRRAEAPDDSAGDCGSPESWESPQATRKQAMDLLAAILVALRKRDGAMVVGAGTLARWQLKREAHSA